MEAQISDAEFFQKLAPAGLTPRQVQIARGIEDAKTYKIIAHEIGLTEGTVKVYSTELLRRCNIGGRAELALAIYKLRLQQRN